MNRAEKKSYKDFIKKLCASDVAVDTFMVGVFSDKFNRDIYFLNEKTRLPYQLGEDVNIKGRKSIILLWVDEKHYEVVGRLLPGNKIQREFAPDDSLIKLLHMFLFEPRKVGDKYPSLISYLPKDVQVELSKDIVDSLEEKGSSNSSSSESDKNSSEDSEEEKETGKKSRKVGRKKKV